MVKRKIVTENCYGMVDGKIQKLEVGTIIESSETAFGKKAVTVEDDRQLEVATPEQADDSDEDREAAISLYVEKFGEKPHGRMKTETIMAAIEED